MAERACKNYERPLTEEDGEYCPHCTAKRAGRMGKAGGIVSALGTATVAVVGAIIFIAKVFGKK